MSVWAGPDCHLVHYPLRSGEQYNLVVTFHSRSKEEWGVTEGSPEEVQSYFYGGLSTREASVDPPAEVVEAMGDRGSRPYRQLDLRSGDFVG